MIDKILPNIDIETAQRVWESHIHQSFNNLDYRTEFASERDHTSVELNDTDLIDLHEQLSEIRLKYEDKNMKRCGGNVDAEIVEAIHSCFQSQTNVYELSQPGFWMWLSNMAIDGFFWDFIKWRFGDDAALINWGITTSVNFLIEGYFSRAWLKGHKMYNPEYSDPYKYARIGSSDIWRSHILRQEFGQDQEFVKAFLDTIYSNGLNNDKIRKVLIPAIRAWTANATFSHLNYAECKNLLQELIETHP